MEQISVDIAKSDAYSYPVIIGTKLLNTSETFIGKNSAASKFLVVTDDNTDIFFPPLFSSLTNKGNKVLHFTIPAGESSKSPQNLLKLWQFAADNNLGRDSAFIALGGGVVGDITGFAASSYMRGVDFIQIPTTLLAMVDSSLGGKTGIDFNGGKNIIGAFYQPKLVLMDTDTLKTLPEDQFKSGLGEIAKYAFIQGENSKLLDTLSADYVREHLGEVIRTCAGIKAEYIKNDEKDTKGSRIFLNFGHTAGHALETIGDFKTYSHGEAVAKGIITAFNIALDKGLIDNNYYAAACGVMEKLELNTLIAPTVDLEQVYTAMAKDKKAVGGHLRFVLPVGRGKVKVFSDITKEEILSALTKQQEK